MNNTIDARAVTKENIHLVRATLEGYGKALAFSRLVNTTGEFAIMGNSVSSTWDFNHPAQLIMNWTGSCVGLTYRDFLMDGSEIEPGMFLVGIEEPGYRCNGGSWFTKLLLNKFGPKPSDVRKAVQKSGDVQWLVRELTIPSQILSPLITDLVGWNPDGTPGTPLCTLLGGAHITGGGMKKLAELLPDGVSAYLGNMPPPCTILRLAQEMSQDFPNLKLSDYDCHHNFHGGVSFVLAVPNKSDAETVIDEVHRGGVGARMIGGTHAQDSELTASNKLVIESRFMDRELLKLNYKD